MLNHNSAVTTSFDFIQAIIGMMRAEGQYFNALSWDDQVTFKQTLKNNRIPRERKERLSEALKRIIAMPDKEEAYEVFLEFIFDASQVMDDFDLG